MIYEMGRGFIIGWWGVLLLSISVCGNWSSALQGAEKVLHTLPGGVHPATVSVSPDAAHFGYLLKRGLRVVPVIDGVESQPVDWVAENQVSFSPNGAHTLFIARRGQKTLAIHDGKAGPLFDGIYEHVLHDEHHAYVARRGAKYMIVKDRQEQPAEFDDIRGLNMTAGGKLAFMARRGTDWHLHIDGEPEQKVDQIYDLRLSPDGKRHAYIRRAGQWDHMIVDGMESPRLSDLTPAVFSPDGRRVAYAATEEGKWIVMVDGQRQETMDRVAAIQFSADGKRMALMLEQGARTKVSIDDREIGQFAGVAINSFAFSRDGSHFAFVARKGAMDVVHVDGVERAVHERIIAQHPVHFAGDGKIRFISIEKRMIQQIEVPVINP